MSTLMPFVVVLLALVAAGSVAVIASYLSSDDFHKSFEDFEDHNGSGNSEDVS